MRDSTRSSARNEIGISSVLAVASGAVLLKMAFVVKNVVSTFESIPAVGGVLLLYLTAFAVMYAGVSNLDIARYGRRVGYGIFVVVCFAFAVSYFQRYDSISIGTDAILFSHYSVDLLLDGQNPYTHSMLPAFGQYPVDDRFVTYRTDGSIVAALSYPALSFLYFIPQTLLGIPNFNLTPIVVLLIVLVFLIAESPPSLALAPFVIVFADQNITLFTYGGVFDILWVLPLLGAMKFWSQAKLGRAAFLVGLAFAVKQTPWFISPFLAVWLYTESPTYVEFGQKSARTVTYGIAGFLLPNIPFIIWNPTAWVTGVFTPIAGGAPLVQQGSGIVLLSANGLYSLPKSYFTVLLFSILCAALIVYVLYFEQLKWTAWIVPALIVWFNYRSLQNYFIFFVPLAYYAVLLRLNMARHQVSRGMGEDV